MKRNIEDYGNKMEIVGFLVGNASETDLILLPDKEPIHPSEQVNVLKPSMDELLNIFKQLDTLDITNSQKVVLRKSQRQIDQHIAWTVYRRDNFRCVYCGNDHTPLTVDHLVLWEEFGDTVVENLVSACRKCNKTRGNQQVDEFLNSDYYKGLKSPLQVHPLVITGMWEEAKKLPKRKPRSR